MFSTLAPDSTVLDRLRQATSILVEADYQYRTEHGLGFGDSADPYHALISNAMMAGHAARVALEAK